MFTVSFLLNFIFKHETFLFKQVQNRTLNCDHSKPNIGIIEVNGTIDYGNNTLSLCHNQCNKEHCETGQLSDVPLSKRLPINDSELISCEEMMKGIYGNFINGKLITIKRKTFC